MEQFIGCDAHKKFSVFVAVNEKGQAGEALRVAHDRQLYREFLARLPAHLAPRHRPAETNSVKPATAGADRDSRQRAPEGSARQDADPRNRAALA